MHLLRFPDDRGLRVALVDLHHESHVVADVEEEFLHFTLDQKTIAPELVLDLLVLDEAITWEGSWEDRKEDSREISKKFSVDAARALYVQKGPP